MRCLGHSETRRMKHCDQRERARHATASQATLARLGTCCLYKVHADVAAAWCQSGPRHYSMVYRVEAHHSTLLFLMPAPRSSMEFPFLEPARTRAFRRIGRCHLVRCMWDKLAPSYLATQGSLRQQSQERTTAQESIFASSWGERIFPHSSSSAQCSFSSWVGNLPFRGSSRFFCS